MTTERRTDQYRNRFELMPHMVELTSDKQLPHTEEEVNFMVSLENLPTYDVEPKSGYLRIDFLMEMSQSKYPVAYLYPRTSRNPMRIQISGIDGAAHHEIKEQMADDRYKDDTYHADAAVAEVLDEYLSETYQENKERRQRESDAMIAKSKADDEERRKQTQILVEKRNNLLEEKIGHLIRRPTEEQVNHFRELITSLSEINMGTIWFQHLEYNLPFGKTLHIYAYVNMYGGEPSAAIRLAVDGSNSYIMENMEIHKELFDDRRTWVEDDDEMVERLEAIIKFLESEFDKEDFMKLM